MIDELRDGGMPAPAEDFLSALDEQLASPETPEVRREMDRLVNLGLEREEARKVMAVVLSFHIVRMLKRKKPFDYPAYVEDLKRLPRVELGEI